MKVKGYPWSVENVYTLKDLTWFVLYLGLGMNQYSLLDKNVAAVYSLFSLDL
jgi:hypothetical protein